MVKLTYIENTGARREVDARAGVSVMDAAHRFDIPGIDGDCGGACATCHVYVEDGWYDRLPPMEELESGMLAFACDVRTNSRLGCQIRLDEALDGLVVRVPHHQ